MLSPLASVPVTELRRLAGVRIPTRYDVPHGQDLGRPIVNVQSFVSFSVDGWMFPASSASRPAPEASSPLPGPGLR